MKTGLLIFSILLLVVGFLLIGWLSNASGACQSATGRIASFFDAQASQNCSSIQTYLYLDYGVLIVGGILFILGLAIPSGRKSKGRK